MHQMFRAIRRVLDEHPECKAVYPIHMNPLVRQAADEELGGCEQIHIIEPIEVFDCHNFEARSFLCLTDSGGIQEECPSYGVPVLVMRDTTERPEGVEAGTLRLVGTNEDSIYTAFTELLEDKDLYKEKVTVYEMDEFITGQKDFVDSINHFTKKVYYELAERIVADLKGLDVSGISVKKHSKVYTEEIKAMAKRIARRAIGKK